MKQPTWKQITDRLCSVTEAAKILGVSETVTKELCRSGEIDATRSVGRDWLIDRRSVEKRAAGNDNQ
ncbi:MAG: helix-turn-helix domain-containing protein [Fuerstiella sp.]